MFNREIDFENALVDLLLFLIIHIQILNNSSRCFNIPHPKNNNQKGNQIRDNLQKLAWNIIPLKGNLQGVGYAKKEAARHNAKGVIAAQNAYRKANKPAPGRDVAGKDI